MGIFSKVKQYFAEDDSGFGILYQSKTIRGAGLKSFLDAYNISIYVNKAIEKRATKVGEIDFILKRGENEVEQNQDKLGILKLLAKPNKLQTGRQFFALWQKYKDIYGEVYCLLIKDSGFLSRKGVTELILLNPKYCEPKFDETGELKSVEYKSSKSITYEAESIIYDINPNPDNQLRGISLLQAGMKTIGISTQLDEYQDSILKNGGKIDGVFNFKNQTGLTKTQREELKKDYQENYAESSKSGIPLFLGGDTDYKRISLNPEELSYLESKKMTLNDICILTEVPKMLLASADDIQYNNADTSLRIFLRETIKPLHEQIADALNEKRELIPEEFELEILDPTPEDVDLKIKLIESGVSKNWMTPNEARELMNFDPIENGDDILVSFSVNPLSNVYEPVEPVEEPTPEPTQESKKKRLNHPLKSYDFRREYHKQFIKKSDAYEKKFKTQFNKYLKGQRDRILELIDEGRIKNLKNKALIDEIFNLRTEITIGVAELIPLMKSIARKAGEDAMKLIGSGGFRMNANIESWLDLKAQVFLRQINETTFKNLKATFAESFANNETRDDLIARLKNTYGDISKGRANVIARTETHGIVQEGTIQGYKQAEMPIKIWVAVMDSDTRDWHASMDGEEVPLNYAFSNGLKYPGDPSGDADEVINCRCTI